MDDKNHDENYNVVDISLDWLRYKGDPTPRFFGCPICSETEFYITVRSDAERPVVVELTCATCWPIVRTIKVMNGMLDAKLLTMPD